MDFNMDEWNVIKKEDGTEYLERKDVDAIIQRVAESAANNTGEYDFKISEEEIAADNLRVLRDMRDQKLAETEDKLLIKIPYYLICCQFDLPS